ncbi:shikimate kinase [Roseateles violae]|uniref:Shikimate kinase n=1 Tax=Roseateles violae TaxID=3058042 RepID=A0ABT8DW56_9BURK|nr:shikimate kinase [Pelomonas sp. PFR6]MDN3921124.1 shikimate kinase [Pelomonas sp. PFR6]
MLPVIALVGMPGGGKSTVGRQLGRQLGIRVVDSDAEIEARLGEPIRSFFERAGEDAFRRIESEVLAEILSGPGELILATGGGIVLREANRELLQRRCTVLYLRSTPEELFRRLRHDTQRPLLQVRDPLAKLRELFAQRDPLYRRCAHYVLETGRPSVHGLVNMALMQLELAGVVDPARVAATVGAEPAAAAGPVHSGP